MSKVKNQENAAVDFAKLFFCLCILFLHTGAYHDVLYGDYIKKVLLRLAVPFFFVTSGYFLGVRVWISGLEKLREIVLKYEKRLLVPYIVFLILNSCFSAYDLYVSGESFNWTVLRLIRAAIFYPPGALWYVWASLIGILILYILIKKVGIKGTCIIGVICYCIGLGGSSYCFLLNGLGIQRAVELYLKVAISTRNGLFVGFPLILLGMMLAKYRLRFSEKEITIPTVVILLFSMILMVGEIAVVSVKNTEYEMEMLISYPIIVSSVLMLLLNINWNLVKAENMVIIRKLSMDMYFVHRPLLTCMRYFTAWREVEISHIEEFFILTILSLAVCVPVTVYQKNKYWKYRK